jgi:hypothetical protein
LNDGQIQNPSNRFGIVPLSNLVPRGFGFVHHSIAILYHEVPNLSLTIRNFFHRSTAEPRPTRDSARHIGSISQRDAQNRHEKSAAVVIKCSAFAGEGISGEATRRFFVPADDVEDQVALRRLLERVHHVAEGVQRRAVGAQDVQRRVLLGVAALTRGQLLVLNELGEVEVRSLSPPPAPLPCQPDTCRCRCERIINATLPQLATSELAERCSPCG